eukprot:gnl/MRDRNA2_/MRDRNA2_96857_c0_seq1.p1 gnl/MRDRNA2_/MRDRNA2_96857_c0~~gnl/MRDRNA2_/MRDRNA2_96857_c0_seq1.p1  ORF type:complete len:1249 (+),score=253.47 gnl/MRDRNA2_/MRDRNA2_96857_c0_seq1:110-3856(+)
MSTVRECQECGSELQEEDGILFCAVCGAAQTQYRDEEVDDDFFVDINAGSLRQVVENTGKRAAVKKREKKTKSTQEFVVALLHDFQYLVMSICNSVFDSGVLDKESHPIVAQGLKSLWFQYVELVTKICEDGFELQYDETEEERRVKYQAKKRARRAAFLEGRRRAKLKDKDSSKKASSGLQIVEHMNASSNDQEEEHGPSKHQVLEKAFKWGNQKVRKKERKFGWYKFRAPRGKHNSSRRGPRRDAILRRRTRGGHLRDGIRLERRKARQLKKKQQTQVPEMSFRLVRGTRAGAFRKYGHTDGCPGCLATQRHTASPGHNEVCRTRIASLIAEDPDMFARCTAVKTRKRKSEANAPDPELPVETAPTVVDALVLELAAADEQVVAVGAKAETATVKRPRQAKTRGKPQNMSQWSNKAVTGQFEERTHDQRKANQHALMQIMIGEKPVVDQQGQIVAKDHLNSEEAGQIVVRELMSLGDGQEQNAVVEAQDKEVPELNAESVVQAHKFFLSHAHLDYPLALSLVWIACMNVGEPLLSGDLVKLAVSGKIPLGLHASELQSVKTQAPRQVLRDLSGEIPNPTFSYRKEDLSVQVLEDRVFYLRGIGVVIPKRINYEPLVPRFLQAIGQAEILEATVMDLLEWLASCRFSTGGSAVERQALQDQDVMALQDQPHVVGAENQPAAVLQVLDQHAVVAQDLHAVGTEDLQDQYVMVPSESPCLADHGLCGPSSCDHPFETLFMSYPDSILVAALVAGMVSNDQGSAYQPTTKKIEWVYPLHLLTLGRWHALTLEKQRLTLEGLKNYVKGFKQSSLTRIVMDELRQHSSDGMDHGTEGGGANVQITFEDVVARLASLLVGTGDESAEEETKKCIVTCLHDFEAWADEVTQRPLPKLWQVTRKKKRKKKKKKRRLLTEEDATRQNKEEEHHGQDETQSQGAENDAENDKADRKRKRRQRREEEKEAKRQRAEKEEKEKAKAEAVMRKQRKQYVKEAQIQEMASLLRGTGLRRYNCVPAVRPERLEASAGVVLNYNEQKQDGLSEKGQPAEAQTNKKGKGSNGREERNDAERQRAENDKAQEKEGPEQKRSTRLIARVGGIKKNNKEMQEADSQTADNQKAEEKAGQERTHKQKEQHKAERQRAEKEEAKTKATRERKTRQSNEEATRQNTKKEEAEAKAERPRKRNEHNIVSATLNKEQVGSPKGPKSPRSPTSPRTPRISRSPRRLDGSLPKLSREARSLLKGVELLPKRRRS